MALFSTSIFDQDIVSFQIPALRSYGKKINESFFYEALDFISKMNKEYTDNNINLYRSILESNGDLEIIHESFGDFFDKVKEIIKKFLEFLKSLVARFITMLNKLIASDNYLIKHKEDLSKFNSEDEFTFLGYTYSFSNNIPLIEPQDEYDAEQDFKFSSTNSNSVTIHIGGESITLSGKIDDKTNEGFTKLKNAFKNFKENLEDNYYDAFRGRVIGADIDISSEDFAKELFKIYRSDTDSKESITVDSSYVKSCYERFSNYSSVKDEVDKAKRKIEKEYTTLSKKIEKMSTTNKTSNGVSVTLNKDLDSDNSLVSNYGTLNGVMVDAKVLSVLNDYMKLKATQVQKMCDIHIMAFSAKLDALRDQYLQDKAVCYKALDKAQKIRLKEKK